MSGFEISISKAADTLMSQCAIFNCTLEYGWKKYMHPFITDQVSFTEVKVYIERKVELGKSL